MPKFRVRVRQTLIRETWIDVQASNKNAALVQAREDACDIDEGGWSDLVDCRVSTVLREPVREVPTALTLGGLALLRKAARGKYLCWNELRDAAQAEAEELCAAGLLRQWTHASGLTYVEPTQRGRDTLQSLER